MSFQNLNTDFNFDLEEMREFGSLLGENKLKFPIQFLNEAAGGIYRSDIIVLTAYSGQGKTYLASSIALENAKAGKNVYMFALEAFKYEIQLRNAFTIATSTYYQQHKQKMKMIFQWYLERQIPIEYLNYFLEAENACKVLNQNLKIKYMSKDYAIENFEKDLLSIDLSADLIIIDHLQFFDFGNEKEYTAINKIVKRLRELALLTGIPIVLVSHLRGRTLAHSNIIIPSADELHGSSNIQKIASKIITLAPNFCIEQRSSCEFPTLVRVCKNRYNGGVSKYVGLLNYDVRLNSYTTEYHLAKLNFSETKYEIINEDFPLWSRLCQK